MSKHKRPGPREDARPESKQSFDDVVSLIKERRKYADWIAALDAKRDQTPEHVYTRVHGDYEKRLDAVMEKLAAHRGSLTREQSDIEKTLVEIEGDIRSHQDTRAETELRGHVGELSAAALTDALRVADTELERLSARRTALAADLSRIAEFVAAAEGTGSIPSRKEGPKGGFDELSFLNSVVGAEDRGSAKDASAARPTPAPDRPSIPARDSSPAAEQAATPAAEKASAPEAEKPTTPPAEKPATPAAERSSMPAAERPSVPAAERPSMPAAERKSEPALAQPSSAPSERPPETAPRPSQPLSKPDLPAEPAASVPIAAESRVAADAPGSADASADPEAEPDKKDEPVLPRPVSRPSIAMQMAAMTIDADAKPASKRESMGIIKTGDELPPSLLEDLKPAGAGETPYAANVASNNPLSLKSAGSGDTKTLKCRECGSMNDPSEWYCERCGAELSAM